MTPEMAKGKATLTVLWLTRSLFCSSIPGGTSKVFFHTKYIDEIELAVNITIGSEDISRLIAKFWVVREFLLKITLFGKKMSISVSFERNNNDGGSMLSKDFCTH
jgi:hypothetical protein